MLTRADKAMGLAVRGSVLTESAERGGRILDLSLVMLRYAHGRALPESAANYIENP